MSELLKTIYTGELLYPTLAAAGLFVAVGAATAWAACSRRHWFLRTAVVGAALAPALLVPGYDFVLIFFTQAALAWLLLTLTKMWRNRAARRSGQETPIEAPSAQGTRLRFTLTDLLLMTAVISAVLAIAARVPTSIWAEWKGIGLLGFCFALYSMSSPDMAALVAGKERLGSMPAPRRRKRKRNKTAVIVAVVLYVLVLCLVVFVFLCPGVAMYHAAIHPTPIPPIALPDPNGYDDLIRAGSQLAGAAVPDVRTADIEELRKFLGAHGDVLETARQGLDRPCQVPLTYTEADLARTDNQLLRELGQALVAEGKLAQLEGRAGNALQSYLDTIRLGKAASNGGIITHALVGWALEGIGVVRLASMKEALTARQCRDTIGALETFDATREPLEDILARDRRWTNHAYGKFHRALEAAGIFPSRDATSDRLTEQSAKRNQAKMRLLIGELAVQQYRLEHGSAPEKLADLVPGCLPAVPIDPYSGNPLIYRPTSSGYDLYSVGPDGVDDGGKPMERGVSLDIWPGDLHVYEPALDGPPEPEG